MQRGRDASQGPPERKETVRRRILALLSERPFSAREISGRIGIPEREVYAHLPHVDRSAGRAGGRLSVTPAECRRCGFAFRKRDRFAKPGRCPVCRGESISEPHFLVEKPGT
jgi:transcriptional regulator